MWTKRRKRLLLSLLIIHSKIPKWDDRTDAIFVLVLFNNLLKLSYNQSITEVYLFCNDTIIAQQKCRNIHNTVLLLCSELSKIDSIVIQYHFCSHALTNCLYPFVHRGFRCGSNCGGRYESKRLLSLCFILISIVSTLLSSDLQDVNI